MKYNKIMIFFGIALIFSTVMRFFQISFAVEFETGFFKTGFEGIGNFILAAIFAVALLSAVFGMLSHKRPEHPPEKSRLLGLVSFLPAMTIVYEVFIVSSFPFINAVQALLLKITAALAAAYFIAYGIKKFVDFKIPELASAVPCVYVIVRIICDFTSISSLALISDNILLIGAYCLILLFMLNFTKLYNAIDTNGNFRKLLATGTAASILCISQSIPYLIINITHSGSYNHITPAANLSILAMGIFITVFILAHFSKKNTE